MLCRFMQFTGCDQPVQHSQGQNMQLSGCHNGDEMRNATCADAQISIE